MSGQELKITLKKTGISQSEIAKRLGVTPQTVSAYFMTREVSTSLLERLCGVLDVPMSYFYDGGEYAYMQESESLSRSDAQTAIAALSKELDYFREQNARLTDALLRLTDRQDAKEKTAV